MKQQQPTAEDWIILRLIVLAVESNLGKACTSADLAGSVLFLRKKLGTDQVNHMIDTLKGGVK